MVKIIGKIKKVKKSRGSSFSVMRKKRLDSCDCTILREYGHSDYDNCKKTCDLLNESADNTPERNKKNHFNGLKIYLFFPTNKQHA